MDEILRKRLTDLANEYEVSSFCDSDPSQFLRWYPLSNQKDVEIAAFIAAMLSFGNRLQFIPKIRTILDLADKTSGSISNWILSGSPNFPRGEKKFYRFYSYDDMITFFEELAAVVEDCESLGKFLQLHLKESEYLYQVISASFPKSAIVPKGKNSANKRIHMFLRWMVRTNSPVDLGIWTWYSPSKLLIPLDIHVMQESIKLGLLPENAKATCSTAIKLTDELKKVFPEDPTRADFALFGIGVNS